MKLLKLLITIAVSILDIYLIKYERNDIPGLFIYAAASSLILLLYNYRLSKIKKLYTSIVIENPFNINTKNLDRKSYFKFPAARRMSNEIKQKRFATEKTMKNLNGQVIIMTRLYGLEIVAFLIVGIWALITVKIKRLN